MASAQSALADWADDEPENPILHSGHPSPAWLAWRQRGVVLNNALDRARIDLAAAGSAVAAAQAALAAATNNLTAAQQQVTAAQAGLAAAQQRLSQAQAGLTQAQQAVQAAADQLAQLDARIARLLAAPLNVGDLLVMAEEELDALQQLRRSRASLFARRHQTRAQRAANFTAHDQTMDDTARLISQLTGLTDPVAYPEPAAVANTLKPLVAASQTARTQPASQRSDDLRQVANTVAGALTQLQAAAARARQDRDEAYNQLQAAAAAVKTATDEAP